MMGLSVEDMCDCRSMPVLRVLLPDRTWTDFSVENSNPTATAQFGIDAHAICWVFCCPECNRVFLAGGY